MRYPPLGDMKRRWIGTAGAIAMMIVFACDANHALTLRQQVRAAQVGKRVALPVTEPEVVLSGEAVIAANGALAYLHNEVLGEVAGKGCAHSPRGLDVAVWRAREAGQWIVRIVQRADRCGRGGNIKMRDYDWWEVYRVSSEGVVLARASRPEGETTWSEDAGTLEPSSGEADGGDAGEVESELKGAQGLTPDAGESFSMSGLETPAQADAGVQWSLDAGTTGRPDGGVIAPSGSAKVRHERQRKPTAP